MNTGLLNCPSISVLELKTNVKTLEESYSRWNQQPAMLVGMSLHLSVHVLDPQYQCAVSPDQDQWHHPQHIVATPVL